MKFFFAHLQNWPLSGGSESSECVELAFLCIVESGGSENSDVFMSVASERDFFSTTKSKRCVVIEAKSKRGA